MEIGDKVTRMLAGEIPHPLLITAITDERIICGAWEFDKATGAEIDPFLDWGPPPLMTGSFLKEIA
jgi:hypothetical protein